VSLTNGFHGLTLGVECSHGRQWTFSRLHAHQSLRASHSIPSGQMKFIEQEHNLSILPCVASDA
jgi:hypothetical protein